MHGKMMFWDKNNDFKAAVSRLAGGQAIIASSDTVLGILAPFSPQGRATLDLLKERDNKPYITLINSLETLQNYSAKPLSEPVLDLLNQAWPGPLTIIIKAHEKVPTWAKSATGTMAFRIPRHQGLLKLLGHFGILFSTSANRSRQPTPATPDAIDPLLLKELGAPLIDSYQPTKTPPSTILDLSGNKPHIVRHGAYQSEALNQLCEKIIE
jgi:L-threonylcarbamoyladenylate synthase